MDQDLKTELSKHGIFATTFEELYNWGRKNSVWPLTFGLACCAIEMIATTMARYDLARFGAEVFRPSPRQADLMIVSGTVTKKMAPQVVRLYNQMPEPKYVIAMGACAISGGPFRDGYNVLKGIDRYIPVDVHIPGCPPRPEALIHAFMALQDKISAQHLTGESRPRHLKQELPSEFPVPEFGEHGLEPAQNDEVFHNPLEGAAGMTLEEISEPVASGHSRLPGGAGGQWQPLRAELAAHRSPTRACSSPAAARRAPTGFLLQRNRGGLAGSGEDGKNQNQANRRRGGERNRGDKEDNHSGLPGSGLSPLFHGEEEGPVVLRMRTANRTDDVTLPSLTPVWRSAEFQEREAFDLFGIVFEGHPDLRRILMWEGFTDHPMRKDYVPPPDDELEILRER